MGEGSCQVTSGLSLLRRQATGEGALDKFLDLVQSPFKQSFSTDAFLASLGTSLGISVVILGTWCLLRPYHSLVYAPKLRHSDEKRAPPAIGKGYFSWIQPLVKCHEVDLVDKIGMDATIFLRFMRLCRTLFLYLTILGCVIMIPVNVTCNLKSGQASKSWFNLMTPANTWGNCMYAHVVIAWVFDIIILYFLWRNYGAVVTLRRTYFESPDYTSSLHSRTLMAWDVPNSYRSDDGINKLISSAGVPEDGNGKCAIGRNVKELPELIKQHELAVRHLEKILAKYLRNPDRLPPTRPACKPDKDDKTMSPNVKVDAIEYYKNRMEELERKIVILRKGIDKRDPMSYGFISFPTVSRTHITAKALRGKHPKGTSVKLATKPQDIIWENLGRGKASRRWNGFIGDLLFFVLSVLFVVPNALVAVFLSNLNNIAWVWPEFLPILQRNSKLFAVVQGFLAPTITSIIYLLLPIIMRRLSVWQGDITKSSRERHVTHKLYVFFIINNLIMFTLFGTLWSTIRDVVGVAQHGGITWTSIKTLGIRDRIAIAIFDVSSFWITYLLQRNLGAMLDLAQVVSLIGKSFTIRFLSPTPRERIEWTAPPPFDYATYYNYFLFYTTIALCFSTIQPLVLPVAFVYFLMDSFLKKYTLMYIFVTKVESGGTFWRLIFNRLLFATALFNLMVALIVWSRNTGKAAACVLPLPPILIAFKIYCHRTFDLDTRYYTRGSDRDSIITSGGLRKDKLAMRYSHPALHKKLYRPLVGGKAEHLLSQIVYGNSDPIPAGSRGGINMDMMQRGSAGKKQQVPAGFEVVREEDMDFSNFKNRAEFGDEHGGGAIYRDDYSQGTMTPPPGFGSPNSSRPGSPVLDPMRSIPFGLAGGSGYRGVEYMPVTSSGPPRSPGPSQRSFQGPGSLYDYSQTDARSEAESVTHLLGGQASRLTLLAPGPHDHQYSQYQQPYHPQQQQPQQQP